MSDKIKILQAIDTYLPVIDGPINVVTNYSKLLAQKEECVLAAPAASKKFHYVDKADFKIVRCRSLSMPEGYMGATPDLDKKFKKWAESENFDIIHVHSPFTMARYAKKLAKKQNIPLVMTLHTQYKQDFTRVFKGFKPMVGIAMRFIMKAINSADFVWTVNDASCKILKDYGYKGKIEVVRNGTDFSYPANAEELKDKVNKLHGLEGQKNVFLFVGRVAFYKNLTLMAKALKILKERGEDFRMLIVGSGFDEEAFKKQVAELGLNDRFIFVGSVTDRELLQGYYLRSDLFLFPSTFDTSSLVPIEAAAHKLPTLLIEGSYTAENIVDNENGFLSKETEKDYADKIQEIIAKEGLMRAVGERAEKTIYRSWNMVADEVAAKYKEIIKEFKNAHGDKKK